MALCCHCMFTYTVQAYIYLTYKIVKVIKTSHLYTLKMHFYYPLLFSVCVREVSCNNMFVLCFFIFVDFGCSFEWAKKNTRTISRCFCFALYGFPFSQLITKILLCSPLLSAFSVSCGSYRSKDKQHPTDRRWRREKKSRFLMYCNGAALVIKCDVPLTQFTSARENITNAYILWMEYSPYYSFLIICWSYSFASSKISY